MTTTKAIRLRERPNCASTARVSSIPKHSGRKRHGVRRRTRGQWKNFLLYGEYFKIDVDRSTVGTFDPSFSGWYVPVLGRSLAKITLG
ncbi:MAG: hypothetical protein WDN76_10960 [Alphaproteobacteria bacterium]